MTGATGNRKPWIIGLRVTGESIIAQLADGRTVSVPLAWSWRLAEATPEQRNNFEIMGSGARRSLARRG